MPLGYLDYCIDQGSTFTRNITYVDSSNNNLFANAVSAEGMVRRDPFTNNIIATMNCVFTTVTSNNDTLIVSLTPEQTQSFPNGLKVLPYDIKVTFDTGIETFILGGKILVNFTVTRP